MTLSSAEIDAFRSTLTTLEANIEAVEQLALNVRALTSTLKSDLELRPRAESLDEEEARNEAFALGKQILLLRRLNDAVASIKDSLTSTSGPGGVMDPAIRRLVDLQIHAELAVLPLPGFRISPTEQTFISAKGGQTDQRVAALVEELGGESIIKRNAIDSRTLGSWVKEHVALRLDKRKEDVTAIDIETAEPRLAALLNVGSKTNIQVRKS